MKKQLAVLLACCTVASAVAQEQKPAPKFETRTELVLVDVSVTSSNGEPVTGLTEKDFTLNVNGQVYTGTVVGQNDSRVAPTGKSNFRLLVAASGVTFAGKGHVGTSMQSEIERRR